MKAKVIETGEIVNVTPNPTWYKENGQGPDRREFDEDELEFIYSNKKEEKLDLEKALSDLDREIKDFVTTDEFEKDSAIGGHYWAIAKHAFLLGLKVKEVKEVDLDALGVLAEHLIACDAHLVTPKYTDKELNLLEEWAKNNKTQKGEEV